MVARRCLVYRILSMNACLVESFVSYIRHAKPPFVASSIFHHRVIINLSTMAFLFQYKAIQRHVKQELQRASEFPDDVPATAARLPMTTEEMAKSGSRKSASMSISHDPYMQIPGITVMADNNGQRYYQVDWTDPDDPFNPKTWSTPRRICSTLLVCVVAFIATAASAIDAAVLTKAAADFGVSEVAESLATALFLVGFGFGALLSSPLSEFVGRYPVYLGSLVVFGCWTLGAALAPTFAAQLIFRFLAGFSASTPLTVAGGSIGDLWNPLEKTFAFPLFAVPAFGGPILGWSLTPLP